MRKKRTNRKKPRSDTSAKKKRSARRKKIVVPKTRNSGTQNEREFWQMIRHVLRKRTVYWLPIIQTRNDARVPYTGPNKRRKYSYICEECKGEFAGSETNVHHIEECGSLNCAADLPGFVERLFCEKDKLKLLCLNCHQAIHEKTE